MSKTKKTKKEEIKKITSDLNIRSKEDDKTILENLKFMLQQDKKPISEQENKNKLSGLFNKAKELYSLATQNYKLGNDKTALICYELANLKYFYYKKIVSEAKKNASK